MAAAALAVFEMEAPTHDAGSAVAAAEMHDRGQSLLLLECRPPPAMLGTATSR